MSRHLMDVQDVSCTSWAHDGEPISAPAAGATAAAAAATAAVHPACCAATSS